MPQIKQSYTVNGKTKTRKIRVGLRCYSLMPRKPLPQKEVEAIFKTLEKEKRTTVKY